MNGFSGDPSGFSASFRKAGGPSPLAAQNERLHARAREAGLAAGNAAVPVPMVVVQANPLTGQPLPGAVRHVVPSGVCGFAGVIVRGSSSFGRWAKKAGIGRSHYGGGLYVRVSDFGQSLERKEAYAAAYARVLNEAGVSAYVDSRMD